MTSAPEGAWCPTSPKQEPVSPSYKAVRWAIILVCILLFSLLGLHLAASQTHQHEQAQLGDYGYRHAEFHDFYQTINARTKRNCCSADNRECRPTNAFFENNTWFAVVDGQTIPVPAHAIVEVENLTDYAHVCAVKHQWSATPSIHCFIKPALRI